MDCLGYYLRKENFNPCNKATKNCKIFYNKHRLYKLFTYRLAKVKKLITLLFYKTRNYDIVNLIVKKYIVGITGMGLMGFIFVHMAGNVFIFFGPEAYNLYAHSLMTNSFIAFIEIGLVSLFVLHIILAGALELRNRAGKACGPVFSPSGDKGTALYQRTLIFQGGIILIFVILHLITFKYGQYYEVTYNGETVRDLFRLVDEVFQSPWVVGWYLLALGILFFHIWHGFRSSFLSLGLGGGEKYLNRASLGFSIVVILGFMSQPLYIFFF